MLSSSLSVCSPTFFNNHRHKAAPADDTKASIIEILDKIYELMKTDQVKFDLITKLKVGKDIGNSMKLGDPDLAAAGRKCVGEIQALAQRNAMLG